MKAIRDLKRLSAPTMSLRVFMLRLVAKLPLQ